MESTDVIRPGQRRSWKNKIVLVAIAAAIIIVAVATSVFLISGKSSTLPASAKSMAGALRPAHDEEISGAQVLQNSIPNKAALNHIYVATRDIQTVAVDTPIIILLTRDAHNPAKITRWLGGALGEIILLLQDPEANPGEPYSLHNAVGMSTVYYDPICQLVPLGYATWQTCLDIANRTVAAQGAQTTMRTPTPDEVKSINPTPSAKYLDEFRVATGYILFSPAKSRLASHTIILSKKTQVTGGELGLNRVVGNIGEKNGFSLWDNTCYNFNAASSQRKDHDNFLPTAVLKHYGQICPYEK